MCEHKFKTGDVVYVTNKDILSCLRVVEYGVIIDVDVYDDSIMYRVELYPQFGLARKCVMSESWLSKLIEQEEEIDVEDISKIL